VDDAIARDRAEPRSTGQAQEERIRQGLRTERLQARAGHAERAPPTRKASSARGARRFQTMVRVEQFAKGHSGRPPSTTLRTSASSATMANTVHFIGASKGAELLDRFGGARPGAAEQGAGEQQEVSSRTARTARHSRRFANAGGAPESLRTAIQCGSRATIVSSGDLGGWRCDVAEDVAGTGLRRQLDPSNCRGR